MRRIRPILSSVTCQAPPYFVSTLSHKRHDFRGKKYITHKICVIYLLCKFVRNIYHTKNNSTRYCHKCTQVLTQCTRYASHILLKLEYSRQIFEKSSKTKFHEIPSAGSQVVPCRQTDRQTR